MSKGRERKPNSITPKARREREMMNKHESWKSKMTMPHCYEGVLNTWFHIISWLSYDLILLIYSTKLLHNYNLDVCWQLPIENIISCTRNQPTNKVFCQNFLQLVACHYISKNMSSWSRSSYIIWPCIAFPLHIFQGLS